MLGLTTLGLFHTALSLIAVAAGVAALVRFKQIAPESLAGKIYIYATAVTCLTGFGIFQHDGFGKAHVLGLVTLAVLGLAWAAGSTALFGRASVYVKTVSYTTTFFFQMIPGFTETATRLPVGAPLASGPDEPALQAAIGAAFVVFLIGAALQVRGLQARTQPN